MGGTGGTASALTDAQIVGFLQEVNTGEINVNLIAVTKATRPQNRTFAQQMVDEHSAANARVNALGIAGAESTPRAQVRNGNVSAQAMLNATPAGNSFDRAHAQSQVQGHSLVWQLIDANRMQNAVSAAVRNEVTTLRAAVMAHLAQAQALQASIPPGP